MCLDMAKEEAALARDATRTAEWYIHVYKLVPCGQVSLDYEGRWIRACLFCTECHIAAD